MRKRLQTFLGVVITALMLLIPPAASFVSRHRALEQAVALDHLKREQVLARSQPFLPALMAGSTRIASEISLSRSYRASGQTTPTWIVDSSDSASGKNAQIVWNAETGELLHASQWNARVPALPLNAPTTRNAAIGLTWDWFHALPVRQNTETWRVIAGHPMHGAEWRIKVQGGDRVAEFTVNTATQQLVSMDCSPLPKAPFERKIVSLH